LEITIFEVQCIVVIYAMDLVGLFSPRFFVGIAFFFFLLLLGHYYLACDGKFREGGHVVIKRMVN
jgi:hypothetical protein